MSRQCEPIKACRCDQELRVFQVDDGFMANYLGPRSAMSCGRHSAAQVPNAVGHLRVDCL